MLWAPFFMPSLRVLGLTSLLSGLNWGAVGGNTSISVTPHLMRGPADTRLRG
jgi:hypothetical protein